MTRHSRNCTASSVYSYHEKKKDADASGYGRLAARFGKDGVKDFDCCCLSLHPCKDAVITPDGYLYEREAILEYYLAKKSEIRKKIKEFEKQSQKEKLEIEELKSAGLTTKLENFMKSESSKLLYGDASQPGPSSSKESSISNMKGEMAKSLPSYWIPSLTPDNKIAKLNKPDEKVLCPMSGKPLKIKDLIKVKFTKIEEGKTVSALEGSKERYKCPVTGDVLRNTVGCAVLRPTGDVITLEAVKLVKKDMKHPLTGQTITERDIIIMQRGGTGFSSANEHLAGIKARPVMQA